MAPFATSIGKKAKPRRYSSLIILEWTVLIDFLGTQEIYKLIAVVSVTRNTMNWKPTQKGLEIRLGHNRPPGLSFYPPTGSLGAA